jgi:hypothetical protein
MTATQEKCKHAIYNTADAGNVTYEKMATCSYAVKTNKRNKMFNYRHT